jgi:hypothetical protein
LALRPSNASQVNLREDRVDRRFARNQNGKRKRETFTLPLRAARLKARQILNEYPQSGYTTVVERWRQLPDGQIEFTMRRLPTALSTSRGQLGDLPSAKVTLLDVRYWVNSGRHLLNLSSSGFDP